MTLLGKRWTGLILLVLMKAPKRFGELSAEIESISERVLSQRLKELEREGVLERNVFPGPPVKVEYRLSEKGKALSSVIDSIGTWAERWIPGPEQATGKLVKKRR